MGLLLGWDRAGIACGIFALRPNGRGQVDSLFSWNPAWIFCPGDGKLPAVVLLLRVSPQLLLLLQL